MNSNPYVEARREWDERYADLVLGKRNWQITAGGLLLLSLILAAGVVWQSTRSRFIPYVVEVDKLGYGLTVPKPLIPSTDPALVDRMERYEVASFIRDSRSVSSKQSRVYVHQLRNQVDAILVGANTARQDNPRLTTRLPGGGGRDPVRVVLDSRLQLPANLRVFRARSSARTILATLQSTASTRARAHAARGVEVWRVGAHSGRVALADLMRSLAKRGMLHVMVEGGATVFASLLREGLADELLLFLAPKLIGADGISWTGDLGVRRMASALKLRHLSVEAVGEDVLIRALLPPAR